MQQLYAVSYDNFYISEDIVTLYSIENYIQQEKDRDFSRLFSCNFYEDYQGYKLTKKDDGDYELTLEFDEYGDLETVKVTLVKCNMFIKG